MEIMKNGWMSEFLIKNPLHDVKGIFWAVLM
jgi:hypothetical protein